MSMPTARTTGISSEQVKLFYNAGTSSSENWVEVVNLQSIPDFSAEPEQLETTCLSDSTRTYIPGLKDYGSLSFGFLYDSTVYNELYGLEEDDTAVDWKIVLNDKVSTSGSTFTFTGKPVVGLVGANVNAVMTFNLIISLSSDIEFTPAA